MSPNLRADWEGRNQTREHAAQIARKTSDDLLPILMRWKRWLRSLLGTGFTGQVVLHVYQGAVKQYEINERRRPKAEGVEPREAGTG